jgi:UDP-N-acetylmuramoyl-L-alanyl-D-glutamate--2,6-diaminopimelate ligase
VEFVAHAAASGAVAVLAESTAEWTPDRIDRFVAGCPIPVVPVPGLSGLAGTLAARFFGDPSRSLRVIGVTGTNGKTSISHFLAQALDGSSRCALIGTLGNGFPDQLAEASHTTPDAIQLQALLADFVAQGAETAVMEVSSHALHQERVAGVAFDLAVFTNLSRDHLDYHRSMEAYGEAKARLFTIAGLSGAVINADDPFGQRLLATLRPEIRALAYGLGGEAPAGADHWLSAETVETSSRGLRLRLGGSWGPAELSCGLLGRFNAYNLLAVLGTLLMSGIPFHRALQSLAVLRGVPGRMERFAAPGRPAVVVDYAHTPDALAKVLEAVRDHCTGRLVCVFGCGGDRDRGKRPLMGEVAERLADVVVVTDDNPRSEDGAAIVADILGGVREPDRVRVERERGRAIAGAIAGCAADDWVVVAGKGHETDQLVGDLRLPFSDREEVRRLLAGGGG